jgi:nucleotide-binding universal stress UspA family protein
VREQVPEEVKVQHIVAQGTIYHEIIQAAEQVDADLIVMASHRPELEDYLIGPNATRVVRHCNRSVLVVRN